MRFGVLGPLEVWTEDQRPVSIPGVKVRALLVDLLLQEGRPVSADRLVEDLWGDHPPGNSAGALQAMVSRLRRALEAAEPGGRDLVVLQDSGYRLDVAPTAVDIGRFTALTTAARAAGDRRGRVALLADALATWRGPAAADFADELFAISAVSRLEELRLTAVEDSAEARLGIGEHAVLAGELGDLVDRHPLRERLRAVHVRALYRAGRQSEALASVDDLRARLGRELGVDPGPEITALREAILRQDDDLNAAPVAEAGGRTRTNLPAAITALIGRGAAVEEVTALLAEHRLVTLVGSGGVGKTRLGVEIATRAADRFAGGAWLVELSALGRNERPDTVHAVQAVAAATTEVLGIREDRSPGTPAEAESRVAAAVNDRDVLLLLDNCEHVVDAVARFAGPLLRSAPRLRILATSQEPIGLPGEVVWKVAPLELPDPAAGLDVDVLRRSGAVELFVTRAAAASPGFTLTAGNARAVAVLCKRLDGIPLALELAATRVRALGVQELVDRLHDRFRLLATGHRGAPPRQQTLRSMIDWSWGLLTGRERILLRRLAVFTDSCTLVAAEEICGGAGVPDEEVPDLLARLVDRSLVSVVDSPAGLRYRLLESVGIYCAEQLGHANESTAVQDRHQTYYVGFVEQADAHLRGAEQDRWLDRLDQESANIRQATDRAIRHGHAAAAVRLANGMAWYRFLRGRLQEAGRALHEALALDDTDAPVPAAARARAVTWHAGMALLCTEVTGRAGHSMSALDAFDGAGDPAGLARARWFLGLALYAAGDLVTSEELVNQAVVDFREVGDRWGTAAALSERAKQALARGDLAALHRDGTRSAELFRELGDRWGQLQTVYPLAAIAEITGDYTAAAQLHRDGLAIAEDLGLWTEASDRLAGLGRIALLHGALNRAQDLHERALRLATDHSFKPGEMYARIGLALGARKAGQFDAAEAELHIVLEWNRQVDFEPGNTLILAELGFVAEQRGDEAAARRWHLAGFTAAQHVGDLRALALALEGLAGVEALVGRTETAAQLLGAAAAAREATGAPLPKAERDDVDRITLTVRTVLSEDKFAAAFADGQTMKPEQARNLLQ
jgi:predicted ATPase/DNA-binding SARP family transcriptional activator